LINANQLRTVEAVIDALSGERLLRLVAFARVRGSDGRAAFGGLLR
jgi:hypothetical protein